MIPKRVTQTSSSLNSGPGTPTSTAAIQKSSIYDWDNPSSFTGSVKRRPTSGQESDPKSSSSSVRTSNNHKNQKKDTTSLHPKSGGGNRTLPKGLNQGSCDKSTDVEKSQFHTQNKPIKSTSNTNNMSCHSTSSNDEAQSKHKVKAARQRTQKIETTPGKGARVTKEILKKPGSQTVNATPNHLISLRSNSSGNILTASPLAHRSHSHNKSYTELYCDFPESYDSMDIIANLSLNTKPLPPPYRGPPEPPPPPPPPSFQIPSLNRSLGSTPEEKQKFGGKQQRKGLIKGTQSQMGVKDSQPCLQQNESSSHTPGRGFDKRNPHMANESSSTSVTVATSNSQSSGVNYKQKSPGRGCVSELKNCISRINGRGLFSLGGTCSTSSSSGTKHSDEALNKRSDMTSLASSNADNNEYSEYEPPIKAKVQDGEDILAKPEFSSSLFKNIPVRPRKGGIPHMENYCLFDPSVDFINEKELKKIDIRDVLELTNTIPMEFPHFSEEELIEEIIYDDHLLKDVDDEDYPSENNYFTIEGDYLENDDDDDGDGDNEVSEETAESLEEETDNQETQSDNNECKEASNEALDSTPTSNEGENLTSSKTSATSSDSQDTEPNDNSTKEKSNFEESEKEKLGQAQSGHPITAVVRPKPFLNLSPFTTNSLRSSRSATNYAMEKPDLRFRNRTIPIESNYVLFNPGPVPSRIQYKIRKPRPLSTHSDADSGFLSPCSPDELEINPTILVLEQCDSIQGYIEIYTDWANYYPERAKPKKKITDLSSYCRDGILLADVIEAVTSFKAPDLVKKPKNQQQMFDNVKSCITALRTHSVGGLESVPANNICAGRLKAVLALFFALSRCKQQSKQQKTGITRAETQLQLKHQPALYQPLHTPQTSVVSSGGAVGNDAMTNRQIPVPYSKTNGGAATPLPATVLVQRTCPPDKVHPLPPTPNHTPSIPGLAKSGDNTSRPGSPPSNNSSSNHIQAAQKANNNGVRLPPCTIPASPYTAPHPPKGVQKNCVAGNGGTINTGPS